MEINDRVTEEAFAAMPLLAKTAREKSIAVGVSGGPDSMALCWLLSRWAQGCGGPQIHALSVDHGLREGSAEEARQVGMWLKHWPHVRHTVLTRVVTPAGTQSRVMERARADRYRLMAEYCRAHGVSQLFLAHHLDDQQETFLFRLAKGSGLDGLAAMQAVRSYDENLELCRPLLPVAKADLLRLCEENDIPFILDPSNESPDFARPRLRLGREALEREGLSAKRVAVTAARIARARDALAFYAAQLFEAALEDCRDGQVALDFEKLAAAPPEIRLRVLQKCLERVSPGISDGYGPRLERLEALEADIFGNEAFKSRTLARCVFARSRDRKILIVNRE